MPLSPPRIPNRRSDKRTVAGPSVTIPIAALGAELADLARAVPTDTKPLLRAMGVYLGGQAKRSFDEQRSPDGVPWKPRAMPRNRPRDRKAARSGRGTGQKLLRDTNLMMAAASASAASPGSVYELTDTYLEQGVAMDRAWWHQHGVLHPIRPKTKRALSWPGAEHPVKSTSGIPARPFLGITDAMADRLALYALDYFSGGAA